MFRASSINEVELRDGSAYVETLVRRLRDVEKNRINSADDLVVRKAVFGLLEVVAQLEARLRAVEGDSARHDAARRLAQVLAEEPPEYATRDDKETAF